MTWVVYDGVTGELDYFSSEEKALASLEESVAKDRQAAQDEGEWCTDTEDSFMAHIEASVHLVHLGENEDDPWDAKIVQKKEGSE